MGKKIKSINIEIVYSFFFRCSLFKKQDLNNININKYNLKYFYDLIFILKIGKFVRISVHEKKN